MKNEWKISTLSANDAETVFALYGECVNDAQGVDDQAKKIQMSQFRSVLFDTPETTSFKLTDASSKIVGFSSYKWMSLNSSRDVLSDLWLSWIGVTQRLRRSGAATELMKHFRQTAMLDECETYSLGTAENNTASQRFFGNFNVSYTGVNMEVAETKFPVYRGNFEDIRL